MGTTDDFVALVKDRFLTTYGELVRAKGIPALLKLLGPVLRTVEKVALEGATLTGAEKKEAAVALLNDLIDIPVLPEWLEAKVLGLLVDGCVAFANSLFSKLWVQKAEPVTP